MNILRRPMNILRRPMTWLELGLISLGLWYVAGFIVYRVVTALLG